MARKQTKNTETKPPTFCITAPEALSVMLVGDFTHWQDKRISMEHLHRNGTRIALLRPPRAVIIAQRESDAVIQTPIKNKAQQNGAGLGVLL
jgi:hypothetical protein